MVIDRYNEMLELDPLRGKYVKLNDLAELLDSISWLYVRGEKDAHEALMYVKKGIFGPTGKYDNTV